MLRKNVTEWVCAKCKEEVYSLERIKHDADKLGYCLKCLKIGRDWVKTGQLPPATWRP